MKIHNGIHFLPNDDTKDYCLNLAFFSLICPEKGVDIILDTAGKLPDFKFDFWGIVQDNYKEEFQNKLSGSKNIEYRGVFIGSCDEVINELMKYDVLLLPTRWQAEGVPGILVESKIAGIPAIVSDYNYNSEIVSNQIDGIVMSEYSSEELVRCIKAINDSEKRKVLGSMAKKSAEKYYIDNYIENICHLINV